MIGASRATDRRSLGAPVSRASFRARRSSHLALREVAAKLAPAPGSVCVCSADPVMLSVKCHCPPQQATGTSLAMALQLSELRPPSLSPTEVSAFRGWLEARRQNSRIPQRRPSHSTTRTDSRRAPGVLALLALSPAGGSRDWRCHCKWFPSAGRVHDHEHLAARGRTLGHLSHVRVSSGAAGHRFPARLVPRPRPSRNLHRVAALPGDGRGGARPLGLGGTGGGDGFHPKCADCGDAPDLLGGGNCRVGRRAKGGPSLPRARSGRIRASSRVRSKCSQRCSSASRLLPAAPGSLDASEAQWRLRQRLADRGTLSRAADRSRYRLRRLGADHRASHHRRSRPICEVRLELNY